MSDVFYRMMWLLCRPPLVTSGRPTVIGRERVPRSGPLLLAPNHVSWYDIPILALHNRRLLDFLAIYKLYAHPLGRWFYEHVNAIRYDWTKPDAGAVRTMHARLRRGRCVVIFPEGRLCRYEDSVFTGHALHPGMARLALSTQTPVLPVALVNTDVYRRFKSWMPVCGARYGVAFGAPIPPPAVAQRADRTAAISQLEAVYRDRMCALRAELLRAMPAAGA